MTGNPIETVAKLNFRHREDVLRSFATVSINALIRLAHCEALGRPVLRNITTLSQAKRSRERSVAGGDPVITRKL